MVLHPLYSPSAERQPAWSKCNPVPPPSAGARAKVISVPIHSSGPPMQFQRTRFAGSSASTFIRKTTARL